MSWPVITSHVWVLELSDLKPVFCLFSVFVIPKTHVFSAHSPLLFPRNTPSSTATPRATTERASERLSCSIQPPALAMPLHAPDLAAASCLYAQLYKAVSLGAGIRRGAPGLGNARHGTVGSGPFVSRAAPLRAPLLTTAGRLACPAGGADIAPRPACRRGRHPDPGEASMLLAGEPSLARPPGPPEAA